MPLKRTVLPLLDYVDHLATATGGANTVVFRPEGRYGYNTDVQGIVDALTEAGAAVLEHWPRQRHDHRRGRDRLLRPGRRRRTGRPAPTRSPDPVPRRGPAGHRRPPRPAGQAPSLGRPHKQRCGGPRPPHLHRPRGCRRQVRRTTAAYSPSSTCAHGRGVPPVAHSARGGGRRSRIDRGKRLRDAPPPGRRPGRAHDRQALAPRARPASTEPARRTAQPPQRGSHSNQ